MRFFNSSALSSHVLSNHSATVLKILHISTAVEDLGERK